MENEELARSWWWILDKVRSRSPTTEAVLRRARFEGVEGDQIILSWPFRFHREMLQEGPRRLLVERAVREVTGRSLRLRCIDISSARTT